MYASEKWHQDKTYEHREVPGKLYIHAEESNWSGSALFVIQFVNLYQQPASSNLIGWKLEVGMAS